MRRDDFRRLREQRIAHLARARELVTEAETAGRDLTAAEAREFDQVEREVRRLNLEIEANSDASETATTGGTFFRVGDSESASAREIEEALGSVQKGEARALSTAVSVSPGELSTVLFDRLRAASVVLASGVSTVRTDADSVTYPALTADAAPQWTAEAAPITPSDPTFGSVVATPRKLAALTQVSNEVLDDSDPPLTNVLTDHLVQVLGLKADAGILEGSGTPPEPTGLKNVAGKQTVAAAANGHS